MDRGSDLVLKVQVEPEGAGLDLPAYATDGSAAMDLRAAIEDEVTIAPGARELISVGFRMELPPGYEAQVRPRSGLALKHGITLLNTPGTIDSDYRGTVGVILINLGADEFVIRRGDRIAQMVIAPVSRAEVRVVEEVGESRRGDGGFGHTGLS
ncbi:MAG: dUTP diphosphatase [candidate division WS1 bacterium]|jgi:dUTP pyrophosphatase|nr:dUTP diphosphatase [candidate division WS1 bacterium]